MANTDLTLIHLQQIDEFIKKHPSFKLKILDFNGGEQSTLSIPIGNAFQLGTLLSRIEQKTEYAIVNLMDYVKYFYPINCKYLILSIA